MKSCPKHRPALALLAADALNDAERFALRVHLESCPDCRRYLSELSQICQEHTDAAKRVPALKPSEDFQQRWCLRRESEQRVPRVRRAAPRHSWWAAWGWPVALALGVILLLVIISLRRTPIGVAPGPSEAVATAARPSAPARSPTTLLTYRLAAERSLDSLDALLTHDAQMSSDTTPPLTALNRDLSASKE